MDKQYPQVTVGCFILNNKKEILLVKSYKWAGKWVVMGGHIELGETIKETCLREVKEEVGLDIEFVRVIEVAEFVYDLNFHDKKHFIGLQCECKLIGDQNPTIDNDEIQEARWFPLLEAVKLDNILPITKQTIKKIMGDK
jgi:nucleoside triphosphatase